MLIAAAAALLAAAAVEAPAVGAPALAASAAAPAARRTVVLPADTEIELVFDETVSTKTQVKGDLLRLRVSDDVVAGGVVAIRAGSPAVGEVTRSDPKGAFGAAGKLEARLLYARVNGETVRLEGAIATRGDNATAETVLATVAVGTLSFIVTGKSAVIEKGARVRSRLARRVEVTVDP